MKHLKIIFVLLLFGSLHLVHSANVFAQQSEVDLFNNIQKLSKSDKKLVDQLLIFTEKHAKVNRKEALQYLEKIKTNAIRIDYGKALLGYAKQRLNISLESSDFKNTYQDLQALYKSQGDLLTNQEKSSFLILLSRLASNLYLTGASMSFLDQAYNLYHEEPNLSSIRANRGIELHSQGKYDEASKEYFLALNYFEANGMLEEQASVNSNLGRLYTSIKDFKRSLLHYKKALKISEKIKNDYSIALLNTNIGTAYQSLDSNNKALRHYSNSLNLARKLESTTLIAQNLLNKANVLVKLGQFKNAEIGYQESLKICYQKGVNYGILLNYLNLGFLYNKTKEYPKSLAANDSALVYAKRLKLPSEQKDIYNNITDTYVSLGNYRLAFESLKKTSELNNELLSKDKQKVIEELSVKHETALKENALMLKDVEIVKANERSRFILAITILVILVGGMGALYLTDRNKNLNLLYQKNIELLKVFKNDDPLIDTSNCYDKDPKLLPIFEQLKHILSEEELFKNPELSISMLSERLNSNDKYISTAINQFTGMNFNYLVNTFRVNKVKSMIIEKGEQFNLSEVMYACGFINRSTFYKVFIKHTGMSPKQFRSMVLNKEQDELLVI